MEQGYKAAPERTRMRLPAVFAYAAGRRRRGRRGIAVDLRVIFARGNRISAVRVWLDLFAVYGHDAAVFKAGMRFHVKGQVSAAVP